MPRRRYERDAKSYHWVPAVPDESDSSGKRLPKLAPTCDVAVKCRNLNNWRLLDGLENDLPSG